MSIHRDVVGLDDLAPVVRLALDQGGQRLRAEESRLHALQGRALLHVRRLQEVLSASDSLAMASGGVPAGANRPTQASSSKPGRPASAVVGTSGSMGWRVLLVTARALSLPVCTWPSTEGGVVMNICT